MDKNSGGSKRPKSVVYWKDKATQDSDGAFYQVLTIALAISAFFFKNALCTWLSVFFFVAFLCNTRWASTDFTQVIACISMIIVSFVSNYSQVYERKKAEQ